ncbi:MAG: sulfurtransferase TusA [Gammaproteobacteria bacterium]|nr:MAG: sulfurtransferase TusA [Gammaproteobacteria bacterium]
MKDANASLATYELDTRGLLCPEPVMMLHKKIREVPSGAHIRVLATDPSTTRDIPKFCNFLGHELVEEQLSGEEYSYLICKKDDPS